MSGLQPGSNAAAGPDGREPWLVQFYSPSGEHLRTLRVPAPHGAGGAGGVAGLSWEGGGLRLALAVDSAVLFGSVRHDHLWGYFGGSTLAYAFVRADRPQEHCVVFWDTRTNSRWVARRAQRAASLRQAAARRRHPDDYELKWTHPAHAKPSGTPSLCGAWWACAPAATLQSWLPAVTRPGSTCLSCATPSAAQWTAGEATGTRG